MKRKTIIKKQNNCDFQQEIEAQERLAKDLLSKEDQISHGLAEALRKLTKEIKLFKNHLNGLVEWEESKNKHNTTKVQIGGGSHLLKSFLNIDILPPADLICDVREGLPLASDSIVFIFTEHFYEHLDYPVSAKKFVRECHRVLKKGGQLVLGVPDSQLIVRKYLIRDKKFWDLMLRRWYSKRNCLEHFNSYIDLLNYHFRDQNDDEKYNSHYWAYDFEKMKSLLHEAGFTKIKKWEFDKTIAKPEREWASLYVAGVK